MNLSKRFLYLFNILFIIIFYFIAVKNGYLDILNNKILMGIDTSILILAYVLVFSVNIFYINRHSSFLKPTYKYEKIFLSLLLITLSLYITVCLAPIRDADSLRYKANMIKQASLDGGFYFYPYFNYNLQQLWFWGVYPLYYMLGDNVLLLFTLAMYMLYIQIAGIYCLDSVVCENDISIQSQRQRLFVFLSLLVTTPVILLATTTVGPDTFLFYTIAFACLITIQKSNENIRWYYISAAIIGIATSSKIQAILFFFILCLYIAYRFKDVKRIKNIVIMLIKVLFFFLIFFLPVALWNLLSHGEPVYPLLITNKGGYFYIMTKKYMQILQGNLSISNLFFSVGRLFTWWQLNHIATILLALLIFYHRKIILKNEWVIFSFLYSIMLLASNPNIYPRFFVFGYILLLPVVAIFTCQISILRKRIYHLYIPLGILGVIGTSIYSYDHLQYLITKDESSYHKYTMYYNVTEETNRLLSSNDHLLVINQSEQNYYLKVPYLAADRSHSALVNWDTDNKDELVKVVKLYGITHILFDESAVDGSMKEKIEYLLNTLKAKKILEREERLYSRRIFRKSNTIRVFLYEIGQDSRAFEGYKARAIKLKNCCGVKSYETTFN